MGTHIASVAGAFGRYLAVYRRDARVAQAVSGSDTRRRAVVQRAQREHTAALYGQAEMLRVAFAAIQRDWQNGEMTSAAAFMMCRDAIAQTQDIIAQMRAAIRASGGGAVE